MTDLRAEGRIYDITHLDNLGISEDWKVVGRCTALTGAEHKPVVEVRRDWYY